MLCYLRIVINFGSERERLSDCDVFLHLITCNNMQNSSFTNVVGCLNEVCTAVGSIAWSQS